MRCVVWPSSADDGNAPGLAGRICAAAASNWPHPARLWKGAVIMAPPVINFREKFGKFTQPWSPRVVAEMNDYQFKLVRLKGDFVWHKHEDTDEVFMVIAGEMQVGLRDREVSIKAGEMFVIPKGVEHITRASEECQAMIIEPRGVVNTGDAGGALTAADDVWV